MITKNSSESFPPCAGCLKTSLSYVSVPGLYANRFYDSLLVRAVSGRSCKAEENGGNKK